MDTWIHGYMDTWIHGYMDTWIHGYMDTWIHGYMDFSKKLSNFKQSHLYRSRKISENAQNTQLIINGAKQITTNHPCDFKMI